MDIEQTKFFLRTRLTGKRYEHTLAVADEAAVLANFYGCDKNKAVLAGLLHDICKDEKPESLLQMMAEFGRIPRMLEKSAEKLWHARVGGEVCRRDLKVEDEDILNAIRYHTTARAGMSLLEKVIFLADYVSRDRTFDGVEHLRAAVKVSLSFAMAEALVFSMNELTEKRRSIHPDTIAAYNETILSNANV